MFKHFVPQPQTIIMCISAETLYAGAWNRQQLQTFTQFAFDQAIDSAFAAWLHRYPTANVHLIVNTFEEDYRIERLPHVMHFEKRHFIQRKLNQIYRNLNFKTAQLIGNHGQGRTENDYLFCALTSDTCLHPWLEILQSVNRNIVGIYLLPLLSRYRLKAATIKNKQLLLCESLSSGVRHTYIDTGNVCMSRLIPDFSASREDANTFYFSEIEKTRNYLISRRLMPADTVLHCLLLNFDAYTPQIAKQLQANPAQFNLCDIAVGQMDASFELNQVGINQHIAHQTPELFYMHALARGANPPNIAPEKIRRNYRISRMRHYLNSASALCLFFGLILSIVRYQQGLDLQTSASHYQHLSRAAEQRNQQLIQQFPQNHMDFTPLARTAQLSRLLSAYPESPAHTIQILSQALETSEQPALNKIHLTSLHWQIHADMLDSIHGESNSAMSTNHAAYEMAILDGEILNGEILDGEILDDETLNGETLDDSKILNNKILHPQPLQPILEQYLANLRKHPDVAEATLLQSPTASKLSDTLGGQTRDKPAQAAPFKLKVLLKPFYTQSSNL